MNHKIIIISSVLLAGLLLSTGTMVMNSANAVEKTSKKKDLNINIKAFSNSNSTVGTINDNLANSLSQSDSSSTSSPILNSANTNINANTPDNFAPPSTSDSTLSAQSQQAFPDTNYELQNPA